MVKFSPNKPLETIVYKSEKLGFNVTLASPAIHNLIKAKKTKKTSVDRLNFMNAVINLNPLLTIDERRILWDELLSKPLAILNGLKPKDTTREVEFF